MCGRAAARKAAVAFPAPGVRRGTSVPQRSLAPAHGNPVGGSFFPHWTPVPQVRHLRHAVVMSMRFHMRKAPQDRRAPNAECQFGTCARTRRCRRRADRAGARPGTGHVVACSRPPCPRATACAA